jgi:hypothetical protein
MYMAMPWRKPLPLPIKLADGRVLETLLDLGNLLAGDTLAGVTRSPALEHALELLLGDGGSCRHSRSSRPNG